MLDRFRLKKVRVDSSRVVREIEDVLVRCSAEPLKTNSVIRYCEYFWTKTIVLQLLKALISIFMKRNIFPSNSAWFLLLQILFTTLVLNYT